MKTQALDTQLRKMNISPVVNRKRRRYRRAAQMLLRHMTIKRFVNIVVVEVERILGRTQLHGRPYSITIDPTNYCNLRCPLCPTGNGTFGRAQGMLTLDDFKRMIDQISEYVFEISLMNWGEPMLNRDLVEMIRYCHAQRLSVSLSTNLTLLKLQDVDRLLTSGLDYMTVSIDGATQEQYARYRVRGKLDVVLANLRKLLERRAELGLRTPWIRWQFIVMKHNEHEIDEAKRKAAEIGVDEITFIPVGLPLLLPKEEKAELAQEWFAEQPSNRFWDPNLEPELLRGGRCPYLYRTMTLNPGGGISPCCMVYGKEELDFGNLLQDDLTDIWNNPRYISARLVQTGQGDGSTNTVCHGCPLYARDKGVVAGIRHLLSI